MPSLVKGSKPSPRLGDIEGALQYLRLFELFIAD